MRVLREYLGSTLPKVRVLREYLGSTLPKVRVLLMQDGPFQKNALYSLNHRYLVAWQPDELSPAHNIFGWEVRSGIAPLGKNYAGAEADRTNQIVRAGFIR